MLVVVAATLLSAHHSLVHTTVLLMPALFLGDAWVECAS